MGNSTYTAEENARYLADRYAQQREAFFYYLGGKRCARCGTTTSADFHIDHMDRWSKSFTVARLWAVAQLPRVYAELEKCQVLCAQCHGSKTSDENRGIEKGFTHGTVYGWMKKKGGCDECCAAQREWYDRRNAKRRTGARGPYKRRAV